jgi:hypothetical protein
MYCVWLSSIVYVAGVYEATYSPGGSLTEVAKYYMFGSRSIAVAAPASG